MGAWLLLILLIATGFTGIRAVWPAPRRWSEADALRLAAAPAVGLGIGSCLYFALRIVLHLSALTAIGASIPLLLLFAGIAWQRAATAIPDPPPPPRDAPVWLWVIFGIGAAMAALTALMLYGAAPHGDWDAWAIWNLRARFLFQSQEFTSPFSALINWSHPDYPLLVPGAIAYLWHAGGTPSTAIPRAVNFLFLASAVAVPFLTVRLLRGSGMAAVCGVAVLGATSLVRTSSSQYADVPIAAFMVLSCCLAAYSLEVESAGWGPLLVSGLAAGFAAWTKNEGLLFCIALPLAYLLSVKHPGEIGSRLRKILPLVAGILAVLAIVGHFKVRIAPQNDIINTSSVAVLGAKVRDFGRYWVTFWAFVGEFLTFGSLLAPPVLVFSVWLALVRLRPRSELSGASFLPLTALFFQLLGYFGVYIVTPMDLDWHIGTSLSRLLLHVWPLLVTGIFLISRDIFALVPQPGAPVSRSK